MVDTFNPPIPPQTAPNGEGRFNVSEIQYGEGYVGALGEGINNHRQIWPVTWKGSNAEILEIRDFFVAHKGFISFYWTPPLGVQGLYRVKAYNLVPEAAGNASISATLEEYFAP